MREERGTGKAGVIEVRGLLECLSGYQSHYGCCGILLQGSRVW